MLSLVLVLVAYVVAHASLTDGSSVPCLDEACEETSETAIAGSLAVRSMSLLQTAQTNKRGVVDDESLSGGGPNKGKPRSVLPQPGFNAANGVTMSYVADAWSMQSSSLVQERLTVQRDSVTYDDVDDSANQKQPAQAKEHTPNAGQTPWEEFKDKFVKPWGHLQKMLSWKNVQKHIDDFRAAVSVEWQYIHTGQVDAVPERSAKQLTVIFVIVLGVVCASWMMHCLVSRAVRHLNPMLGSSLIPSGGPFQRLRMLAVCLSLCVCSWGMTVANKHLMISIPLPAFVIAVQMIMSVVSAIILAKGRLAFETKQVLKWIVVPFLACIQLWTSLCAIKYLTLSTLMLIRNLGPLVTLPVEAWVMPVSKRPAVSFATVFALLLVLASSATYIGGAPSSWEGFAFAFINLTFAVLDAVLRRRLLTAECAEMPTTMCMLLSNLVGIVPSIVLSFLTGEMVDIPVKASFSRDTITALIMSGVMGAGISFFALEVQREMTATSFMVLENGIRLAEVLAGAALFNDPFKWPLQILGLVISYGGSLWYAQIRSDSDTKGDKLASF